jgi:hypothetical protein
MRSTKTYTLYEKYEGRYTPHWQSGPNRANVPGCLISDIGHIYPPAFPVVVRAVSAKQACYLANTSTTSLSRGDNLGVWWERDVHDGPPPLGKDQTEHWASVAQCRALTIMFHPTREEAERAKEVIDRSACGGGCYGNHTVVRMTCDEAERRRPCWWSGPAGDIDESGDYK